MSTRLARRALTATVLVAAMAVAACSSTTGGSAGQQGGTTIQTTTGTSATSTTTTSAPSSATASATTSAPSSSAATTTAPAPATGQTPATCTETRGWTTGADTAPGSATEELYQVRVGRHDCYDRVVFDVNGPASVGFDVRYVSVVHSEGRGLALPVAGGAVLQVVVRAPELGAGGSGHQPGRVLAASGADIYSARQLAGWPSIRQIRFGGSFEGQCTFAVGVRATLAFRVFTLLDTHNQIRQVVLDVAH